AITNYEVYDLGHERNDWARQRFRQSDLVLFAVAAGCETDSGLDNLGYYCAGIDRNLMPRIDLLMFHPRQWRRNCGTVSWIKNISPKEHHHVRQGCKADFARVARIITGRAINLVLGGGGARALAEFGVLKALQEANIPIDRICGSSMGAFVGAVFAFDGDYK